MGDSRLIKGHIYFLPKAGVDALAFCLIIEYFPSFLNYHLVVCLWLIKNLSIMDYSCVDARFLFFNGQNHYTVEYSYGCEMWFVFEDEKRTDALYKKKINPAKHKSPNRMSAEGILEEYFESLAVS